MQPDANGLKKSMQIVTLTKLLQDLHQELKTCTEHKRRSGGVEGDVADPILLGDFIVDAYNGYLSTARSAFDDPVIQAMSQIERLGEGDDDPRKMKLNHDTRLAKMHEVAFATRQLLICMEDAKKSEKIRTESEISGAITLLENLGEQIDSIADLPVKMGAAKVLHKEDLDDMRHLPRPLAEEYNRCLTIVLETTDDPVISKLFHPVDYGKEDEKSFLHKIAEIKLAQSGLLSYLKSRKTWETIFPEKVVAAFKGKVRTENHPVFSDRVKKVMEMSRMESMRLGHNYIGSEHQMLGIIREGNGKAVAVMKTLGLDLEAVKKSIDDYVGASGDPTRKVVEPPFTPRAKKLLETAANEARDLKSQVVGTEHLVLGMLNKDRDGVPAQILNAYGVDYKKFREGLVRVLEGQSEASN